MKPSESVARYDSEVRLYTNYAIKHIKTMCKNFGPRPVGSEAEINTQEYLAKELETTCDKVLKEDYKCSDKAFMSWVPIGAVIIILSAIFSPVPKIRWLAVTSSQLSSIPKGSTRSVYSS